MSVNRCYVVFTSGAFTLSPKIVADKHTHVYMYDYLTVWYRLSYIIYLKCKLQWYKRNL